MRRTARPLADGRQIIYFDSEPDAPERAADDKRDLPERGGAPEMRRDPLTGEWIAMAAHRQSRTYKPPADSCPLCPSAPDRPSEIPESDYEVAVFENRFPSFARAPEEVGVLPSNPMVGTAPAAGRCEVVCFTSKHRSAFAELDPGHARTVVDAWADRTTELAKVDGVRQVFAFENRGEEIGVTLHHPHGQIYAYPFVTPKTQQRLRMAEQYRHDHGGHVLGDMLGAERADGRRVVLESAHWTAFVPPAARWPLEVLLVPHRQAPDIPSLTDEERDDLAEVQPRLLRGLDRVYERQMPYIAAWHQAPVYTGRDLSWLHLEVFSVLRSADKLKYLAGSESGMGVWISDVTPEQVAERLRIAVPGR